MKKKVTKISELIPDDKNFNKGSDFGNALIQKSFTKFGAGRSILLDKNNKIIAGNKSVENATAIGIEDVQIIESDGKRIIAVKRTDIDLDTPEGRELALADNASAKANIVFDAELIEAEVGEAVMVEWGIESTNKPEAEEDDFDVPVGGSETDIVEGDIFDIGRHRLLCGSSTQTDTWKRLMGEELADLVITDPPYNIDYKGRSNGQKLKNDKQTDENFYQFLYDFYTALGSFTKGGGVWYVWHNEKECVNFYSAFKNSGLEWGKTLIWNKNNLGMGSDYRNKHEPCIYGWRMGEKHNWYSDKSQTTILNFDRPNRNAEHPTMKPIPLIAYQMGNSSKSGDIVCDGFGGSGTTMVAAEQMNRRCRMMELDPRYCQVIVDRMLKLNPSIKVKLNGNPYIPKVKE